MDNIANNHIQKTAETVEEVEKIGENIHEISKVISDTLIVRGDVVIDMDNFSLLSVPSKSQLATN